MGKETLDTGIERNPDINRFENEEVGLEKQTVESVKDAYLTAHRILSKSFKIKDGDPPRHNLGKHNHQFEKGGYLITITVTIGSAKDDFRNFAASFANYCWCRDLSLGY